jgi:hypothetical protein
VSGSAGRPGEEEPSSDDIDRRFSEIVAGLRSTPPHTDTSPDPDVTDTGADPRVEDTGAGRREGHGEDGPEQDTDTRRPQGEGPEPSTVPFSGSGYGVPPGGVAGKPARWRESEEVEEDDHFVPPPPPPLPAGDLHFWAIVVGLTVGPLLLVLSNALPVLDEDWGWVGIGLAVAGFVLLVLRQPFRDREDDWGAQV